MFRRNKKELEISSNIAKCEACEHWFCTEFPRRKYAKCDFCNKAEVVKYHDNPKNLYESSGAIVENRWRWFNIKELFGMKYIRLLLCSEDCMEKLLENISSDYNVKLQLSGTYWKPKERLRFLKYTKNK